MEQVLIQQEACSMAGSPMDDDRVRIIAGSQSSAC